MKYKKIVFSLHVRNKRESHILHWTLPGSFIYKYGEEQNAWITESSVANRQNMIYDKQTDTLLTEDEAMTERCSFH